jgi:hypothetical protein
MVDRSAVPDRSPNNATSSIIGEKVTEITLIPLNNNRPTLVLNSKLLRTFGQGAEKTEAIIKYLRQRWMEALKVGFRYSRDLMLGVPRDLVSLADLKAFLAYHHMFHHDGHRKVAMSTEIAKLF